MTADGTIAVLGTGIMGAGMARNLLRAGFAVRVWNRTRAKLDPLVEQGAVAASTPAEAATGAGVLLTMLADGSAVETAVGGPGGALTALGEGGLWLECSTVGVGDVERFGKLAERAGVVFVDAPVLGTRQPAEEGRLTVFASGPESVRERAGAVFAAIAQRVEWVGPAGDGTRLKLVVNNWLHALLGSLAETIAFARALDVDPRQFLRAIEGGPIGAPYAQLKGASMLAGEYPTSFSLRLATKDVRLVLDAAGRRGLDLPIAEAVVARYGQAVELGHGEEDMASVYEAARPDRADA
jgi:3-hydroxyisobutyrate dehydrogenase